MSKKDKNYNINKNILKEYQDNALQNAHGLLSEAQLLFNHKHYARAYFLACLSMEETGKACIAWTAQGRNLVNEGIHKILKDRFGHHTSKISYAFYCWALISSNLFSSAEQMTNLQNLQMHLINGREKSMYVDIKVDNTITLPSKIVRPKASEDCIKIAHNCLVATKHYIANNNPPKYSSIEDKFFCMNPEKLYTMFQNEDFGHYLIDNLKKEPSIKYFMKCIVTYHDAYYCKKKKYKDIFSKKRISPT